MPSGKNFVYNERVKLAASSINLAVGLVGIGVTAMGSWEVGIVTNLQIFAYYLMPAIVCGMCWVGALLIRLMPRPTSDDKPFAKQVAAE